jgi:alpha-2-macroglobulin
MGRFVGLLFALMFAAGLWAPGPADAQSDSQTRRVILHQEVDYHGFDYEVLRNIGLESCQAACLDDPNCRAFTHNTQARVCFLKSQTSELMSFAGAVAGQVVEAEPEPEPEPGPALAVPAAPAFLPSHLADEAERFRHEVIAGRSREAADPVMLSSAAAQAFNSGDRRAAADLYRQAIARNADDPETWMSLTRALLGTRPPNRDYDRDYDLEREATSAALNAYLLTRNAETRAQALALLASALDRRSHFRPALEAYKASLELAESEPVRQAYTSLDAERGFRVIDNSVESDSQAPRICIQFSEPLVASRMDYGHFVTLDGRSPAGIEVEDQQLCVAGVAHGERYRVALRPGLPAAIGEVLKRPVTLDLYVRDRPATVRFTGDNFVLPRGGASGLPLVTVNTTEVELELYRVGERGLARLIADSTFLRQLGGYEVERLTEDLGESLWSGSLEVESPPDQEMANREVVTRIPLDEALPETSAGIYVFVATAKGARADDWQPKATQWFLVSDIGLTTMTGEDGLHVFARSLATAAPLAGVELQLIARSNEVLATATTDDTGTARFEPGRARGTGALAPALVVAESADDFVFLDFTRASFDLSDRGVEGRPAAQALDLFLYTDRGIYRAGETVHVAGLLRDDGAHAVTGMPLTMVLERPDGVEHQRIVSDDKGLGGHWLAVALQDNAMRGTWRVRAYVDPDAAPIAEQRFLVEDFVPDRIEFELAAEVDELAVAEPATFSVEGRFLYGAAASGLTLEGEVTVARARRLAGWPGFEFGLADETAPPLRQPLASLPVTDEAGRATFDVVVQEVPEGTGPAEATVSLRMREAGGRAVERALTLPVRAESALIGVKPLFEGGEIGQGAEARFEVIAVAPDGSREAMGDVDWSLVKLERNYQWYRSNDRWNYEPVTFARKVAGGPVDIQTDSAAIVAARVDWGRYRLDVESSDPMGPATSVEFTAGWHVEARSTETPDGLEIALDQESYAPGDTARLSISPRFAGRALVAVGAERLLHSFAAEVPEGGAVLDIPVGEDWGAGAYVTVSLFRPGEGPETRLPQRAIGVKWLKVDPGERQLDVSLDLPEKVRPGETLTIPVSVTGLAPGETGRIMLAAVDVGILNITRYQPPEPEAWFFGQRRLGLEIRDFYGRLIDGAQGAPGRIRSGGDAGGLAMQASPPTEPLLALFSGVIETDEAGNAEVSFDIPQFAGTARVMAVAWTGEGVGHATGDVVVRDPVVVTASLPRFLAPGDEAVLRLDIDDAEGAGGDYQLTIEASGELASSLPSGGRAVTLEPGRRTAIAIPVAGELVGTGSFTVRLAAAEGGAEYEKVLTVPVRAPVMPVSRRMELALAGSGGAITLDADLLAGFKRDGAVLTGSISRFSGLDVPSLLLALDRFPYGCAEQTTSKALPLLYLSELSGSSGIAADPQLREKIQGAIDRVLFYQSPAGSFGLWSPGQGDLWLDAYVTDFLTRARELDYEVPDVALGQALDNLDNTLAYETDVARRGSEIAYALYVLARSRRASIGDLRYYADTRLAEFASPMAKAQIAAALGLYGESARAETAFDAAFAALAAAPPTVRDDYGSQLRDGAATLALAAEARPAPGFLPDLLRLVSSSRIAQRATSTQENAWLLLAARALRSSAGDIALEVNGAPHAGNLAIDSDAEALERQPVEIVNRSDGEVQAVITVTGVPVAPLPAGGEGFAIERSYFTLDGMPVDIATAGQNERFVVVIRVTEQNEWPSRILVTDLLPAGLEIDNPRLVSSADLAGFDWLPDTIDVAHTEFRDDRFVAALNRTGSDERSFSLAYVVRAVSPGRYAHPAAFVEDMYRPHLEARTAAGIIEITGPRP